MSGTVPKTVDTPPSFEISSRENKSDSRRRRNGPTFRVFVRQRKNRRTARWRIMARGNQPSAFGAPITQVGLGRSGAGGFGEQDSWFCGVFGALRGRAENENGELLATFSPLSNNAVTSCHQVRIRRPFGQPRHRGSSFRLDPRDPFPSTPGFLVERASQVIQLVKGWLSPLLNIWVLPRLWLQLAIGEIRFYHPVLQDSCLCRRWGW